MILTIVGSGTAAPEPHRVCSGYLLETNGLRMLMDCGSGVVHSLARLDADWRGLTHLLITHFHTDHIGDVPMLFFAWKHGMQPARSEPLTLIGPRGTKKLLGRMDEVFGSAHIATPDFELEIIELEGGEDLWLNDVVRLLTAKSNHTDNSLSFRIEDGGRSFCYTGDTGLSNDVAVLAQAVDALLIECSLPDEQALDIHLTPSTVAAMARIALPRRLLVTHTYPQLDRGRLPELVRLGGWPARVEMPIDGDRFEI
jgi:ribonuclease BN (tRNA processing enzyme)